MADGEVSFTPLAENLDLASRLRGLADLVESCTKPARLRLGVKLSYQGARYVHPVGDLRSVSNHLAAWSARQVLGVLEGQEGEDAAKLRAVLHEIAALSPT